MSFKEHLFKSLIIFCLLLFINSLSAQRKCATMELLEELKKLDNNLELKMEEIEKHTRKFIESSHERDITGVITIPVVVHVIYNHGGENISDAQIQSQMDVLNEDFRRLNADADNIWPQAADSELEFCLASRDPNGDATCGIIRTHTDSTKFYSKTTMKSNSTGGSSPWPYEDYLNIWVCDISGLLGFATFPGGPANLDGVVTDYRAFGTIGDLRPDFALGRTTTHEIGHWLNLRHIWGDGDCSYDDFVSDTPMSDASNYNCNIGHVSCGSVDMVQNYMDYSDDVCMNLFTQGQKTRMRALFSGGGLRESLTTSMGCEAPNNCNAITLTISFDDYPADISWDIRNNSGTVLDFDYGFDNATYANKTIYYEMCYEDGDYEFNITDSYGDGLCCNEGSGSYIIESPYNIHHSSNGQFGSGETVQLNFEDQNYRFVGPGSVWDFAGNWNKGTVPSECYEGEIIVEDECVLNGETTFNSDWIVRIKNGNQVTIQE